MSRNAAIRSVSTAPAKRRNSMAPSAMTCCDGPRSGASANKSAVTTLSSLLLSHFRCLPGVVEDDADRVTEAGPDPADAVAQIDPIGTARPLYRAVMHGEHHGVTLAQRNHLGTRLHSRPLLGQHEFAAAEIPAGLGQQDR